MDLMLVIIYLGFFGIGPALVTAHAVQTRSDVSKSVVLYIVVLFVLGIGTVLVAEPHKNPYPPDWLKPPFTEIDVGISIFTKYGLIPILLILAGVAVGYFWAKHEGTRS